MELTPQQEKVFSQIKSFMEDNASVFILKGYAGTGKTTMVKVIADYISQHREVVLMAPTGRAARVLTHKTGKPALTIHKAIYEKASVISKEVKDIADTQFKYVFPINNCGDTNVVVIVDEASMVCSRKIEHEMLVFGTDNIMEDLLTFVRPSFGGKIIFVGDPAQLPPVGEPNSNALNAEYFKERNLKVYEEELTEVIRQDNDSLILKNAMMIRDLLQKEKRNYLVFEEKENDVETILPEHFLTNFLEHRKKAQKHDSVVICYSNRSASKYNKEIRAALYGEDTSLKENDILMIVHNNYGLNRMNGEFVPVLKVGARTQQSAPVFVQQGGEKKRVVITLNFIQIVVPDGNGVPTSCMLIEDLLNNEKPTLTPDENRALYINFCIRNPNLKQGSKEFAEKLMSDQYYNAIWAKYGYAVTGHKCQGGEWGKVFVDYAGRTGLDNDSLRWAYTATTRARETLYVTNLPHITPFSKFRIDPIQKTKRMDAECRIIGNSEPTPFHNDYSENFLKAKYHCIAENIDGTPFKILSVFSKPYLEIYEIKTPIGTERFDIRYKEGGIFLPAVTNTKNEYTEQVMMILNDEREMPIEFSYQPSDEIHEKLYNMMRSACDTMSVQLTNVVEHEEEYSVIYYMRTTGYFSYIKFYINTQGFVTYAKPMSMIGPGDNELNALINEIKNHLI